MAVDCLGRQILALDLNSYQENKTIERQCLAYINSRTYLPVSENWTMVRVMSRTRAQHMYRYLEVQLIYQIIRFFVIKYDC